MAIKKNTPGRKPDFARRLRAYEMFCSGVQTSGIARELGVARQTVQYWQKEDRWRERQYAQSLNAEHAANLVGENAMADIIVAMRSKMRQRLEELERLCRDENPGVRLQAIKAWFKLAGVDRALPNPAHPTTPLGLELIDDLREADNDRARVPAVQEPGADARGIEEEDDVQPLR